MAQNLGDAWDNAWVQVLAIIMAAAICGGIGFAIKLGTDNSALQVQVTNIMGNMQDMKQDIRDIKRAVYDQRETH